MASSIPTRPSRSPHRAQLVPIKVCPFSSSLSSSLLIVAHRRRCRQIPRRESSPVSVSSEDYPRRPPVQFQSRARASVATQTSAATSSLYPLSTSDATGTESPSSPSTPTYSSHEEVYAPHQLDPDDVSYRLRLLVRNNYYLPPAHSKPLHVDLFREQQHPPKSTILDLFRPAKRSRARTPNPATSPPVRPPFQVYALSAPHISPIHQIRASSADVLPEKETPGRVVVIRERVDDLVKAASKAAQEPRLQTDQQPYHEAEIDPTDVVDLPSYTFEPQASIGNALGLGVDRSVGAAALADFLPGAQRSVPLQDEGWRRALLHQAVDMSMSSIPSRTDASSSSSRAANSTDNAQPLIGQPIIRPGDRVPSPSTPRLHQAGSNRFILDDAPPHTPLLREDRPPVPMRAITPAFPLRSLPPPPRKKAVSPIIQTPPMQFPSNVPSGSRPKIHTIRRSLSTPLLSDVIYTSSLEPPPTPPPPVRDLGDSISTRSHYSYDGVESLHPPRASFASLDSASVSNRPSLSASQQSHVSSAFGARVKKYR